MQQSGEVLKDTSNLTTFFSNVTCNIMPQKNSNYSILSQLLICKISLLLESYAIFIVAEQGRSINATINAQLQ